MGSVVIQVVHFPHTLPRALLLLISHCNRSSFCLTELFYFHRGPAPFFPSVLADEIKGSVHMSEISLAFFSCRLGSFHFPQEAYQCLIRVSCYLPRPSPALRRPQSIKSGGPTAIWKRGGESRLFFNLPFFLPPRGEKWK